MTLIDSWQIYKALGVNWKLQVTAVLRPICWGKILEICNFGKKYMYMNNPVCSMFYCLLLSYIKLLSILSVCVFSY